jgi:hypothetical protein
VLFDSNQAQERPEMPDPMTAILRLPPNAAFVVPVSITRPLQTLLSNGFANDYAR